MSTHSYCSGGNPRIWSSRSDDDGTVVSFLSWKHRLWSSAGGQRQEVERLRLAQSFGGDVKSCLADRCYDLSCLVGRCYARQIFQRLQAVSAGGTWRHEAEVYRRPPRHAQ
ncbi:putative disease resistance RPP13-like protein 3 [Hordeum vulgare]|nr:putative disease resistance RPP13-like protein 3 [Hordeum vulgare]